MKRTRMVFRTMKAIKMRKTIRTTPKTPTNPHLSPRARNLNLNRQPNRPSLNPILNLGLNSPRNLSTPAQSRNLPLPPDFLSDLSTTPSRERNRLPPRSEQGVSSDLRNSWRAILKEIREEKQRDGEGRRSRRRMVRLTRTTKNSRGKVKIKGPCKRQTTRMTNLKKSKKQSVLVQGKLYSVHSVIPCDRAHVVIVLIAFGRMIFGFYRMTEAQQKISGMSTLSHLLFVKPCIPPRSSSAPYLSLSLPLPLSRNPP
jgi:hypothetical protein